MRKSQSSMTAIGIAIVRERHIDAYLKTCLMQRDRWPSNEMLAF